MMSKTRLRQLVLWMGWSGLTALSASALTVDFNFRFISSSTTYSNGTNGGEYTLTRLNGLGNEGYGVETSNLGPEWWDDSLQTFCLERSQHVWQGGVYGGILADGAVPGSPGGTGGIDYLSHGTVYLYSQFAQGILGGYRFDGTQAERRADAYRLQRIIWALEGEIASDVSGDVWYQEAEAYAVDKGGVTADATGSAALGVKVINNLNVNTIGATFTEANQNRQDFLYFTGVAPEPPQPVPDGGSSLILLGVVLCGGAGLRRLASR